MDTNQKEISCTDLMETIALPVQLIPLVHEYLSGSSVDELALKHNMEPTQITDFLNRREVRTFINTKLKNHRYLNLLSRVNLLSDAVEEKLQFAKDNDLPMTGKDLLEIMKLLREESKDLSNELKEDTGDDAKNNYINIINQLKA